VLYSWRYEAPSTINSLYLAQQILRLFIAYSVQSGNSAVGLNSYWLIANVFKYRTHYSDRTTVTKVRSQLI
jgi:hypothetical protein